MKKAASKLDVEVCEKCTTCNLLTIKHCKECNKKLCVHGYGGHISTVHKHVSNKHTKPRSPALDKNRLILHKSKMVYMILNSGMPTKQSRNQFEKIRRRFKEKDIPDEYAKYSKILKNVEAACKSTIKSKTKIDYDSILANYSRQFSSLSS